MFLQKYMNCRSTLHNLQVLVEPGSHKLFLPCKEDRLHTHTHAHIHIHTQKMQNSMITFIQREKETSSTIMAWPNRLTGAIAGFYPVPHVIVEDNSRLGNLRKLPQKAKDCVLWWWRIERVQSALQCTAVNVEKWKESVSSVMSTHTHKKKNTFYWRERKKKKSKSNFTTQWPWMIPGSRYITIITQEHM